MASPQDQLASLIRGVATEIADKQALSELLRQISTGIADLVEAVEESAKDKGRDPEGERAEQQAEAAIKAQALAAALGPVIAALRLPEPKVQVDVQPAATPRVEVTVQPAPVTVQAGRDDRAGQQWRIEIERASKTPGAPIAALVVTRL